MADPRRSQFRATEVGALERRAAQVSPDQAGSSHIGAVKRRVAKEHFAEVSPDQDCSAQGRVAQVASRHPGIRQLSVREVAAP